MNKYASLYLSKLSLELDPPKTTMASRQIFESLRKNNPQGIESFLSTVKGNKGLLDSFQNIDEQALKNDNVNYGNLMKQELRFGNKNNAGPNPTISIMGNDLYKQVDPVLPNSGRSNMVRPATLTTTIKDPLTTPNIYKK